MTSPVKIGNKLCKNRFFAQSMECTDADPEGNPTDLTLKRYEELFDAGWGLIDLEAISITMESRSRLNQLLILEENRDALTKFIKRLREVNKDVLIIFQLTHSGEISDAEFSRRVTVKPIYGYGGDLLTEEEVDGIIEGFVNASRIAHDVGADGIDLKLCHGYLGSQILRPYNDRKWKYGGSWEKRSAFAFDLVEKIKKAVNDDDFLVGSKVSAWEAFPGGFGTEGPDSSVLDLTEPLALIKGLEERGAQYIVQSNGNVDITLSLTQANRDFPYIAYLHQYFQKEFKSVLKPETVLIGSDYTPWGKGNKNMRMVDPRENTMLKVGARNIERGLIDMVGLGRQILADPYLPKKVEEGREDDIKYCTLCSNCSKLLLNQEKVGCAVYNKFYTGILQQINKQVKCT